MTPNHGQVRVAAILGALAVILGAFGAHSLAALLAQNGTLEIWKTASQYHFLNALALLTIGATGLRAKCTFGCLLAGMIIFSGSLYLLAVTNLKWLGAITPVGGVLMIVGWVMLACRCGRQAQ